MENDPNDITAKPGETIKLFTWRNGQSVPLFRGDDGLWRDADGGIYAIPEGADSADPHVRCGIGILSLPEHWQITIACRAHDYAYSTPAYQLTHTRSEADDMLETHIYLIEKSQFTAEVLADLARTYGSSFWENKATDDERGPGASAVFARDRE